MNALNVLLTGIGDSLLLPFARYPAAGLLFWSTITGVVLTLAFGKTSNQTALRRAADRVRAQLLAVKLFKDDLTVTMWCQLALLRATGARLWHSLPPMLVMIVPLLFVLTQLAMRYEFRPMTPGETAVLALKLQPDAWKEWRDVEPQASRGLSLDTGALRDEKNHTIYWRIRASGDRTAQLAWQVGSERVGKEVSIAASPDVLQATNAVRPAASVWDRILYPGEPGFAADSPIAAIEIQYEPRETPIFGINIPWWGTFFLVSMVVALLVGKLIGVQY